MKKEYLDAIGGRTYPKVLVVYRQHERDDGRCGMLYSVILANAKPGKLYHSTILDYYHAPKRKEILQ